VRTCRSVSRCDRDVVRSSFFSIVVTLSKAVDDSVKGCHIRDCPQESYEWHTWIDVESICVICIRFSIQGVH
jgi:hypothetical protein